MTVGQLAEEVATEMGESYGNPDVALQFERWVSEVTGELWDSAEWLFTLGSDQIDSAPGVTTYDLPVTLSAVRVVIDQSTGEPLEGSTREMLVRRRHVLTDVGTPLAWYVQSIGTDGQVVLSFWPNPSDERAYICQFTKLAPVLDDPEAVISLPNDCFRTIKHGVRARYHENVDEFDNADRAEGRYQKAVEALKKRYLANSGVVRRVRFGDISGDYPQHPLPRIPTFIGG